MSTHERSDDPGEHGYGSARQDSNIDEAKQVQLGENEGGEDEETTNRRASASGEVPSNVTRSTQDLMAGGSEKDPDPERLHTSEADEIASPSSSESDGEGVGSAEGLSSSEQAVENEERDLKSGKESPG